MIEYRDPSTGRPSFEGDVAFVVTSGTPFPGTGYFDLSSVPTYNLSASWKSAAAAFKANQTLTVMPVNSISVAVCSQKYHIEPWIVELINGTTTLVELQSQALGNLDPTQLQIAITDCFNHLPDALPLDVQFDLPIALLTTLFQLSTNNTPPFGLPQSSEELTSTMNRFAIPTSVQAYLDDFPFGNSTPPDSKLLIPALVLVAQLEFIYATMAFYIVLSVALIYLFSRPLAPSFDIQHVMSVTQDLFIPCTTALSVGQGVADKIEHIVAVEKDGNISATEAQINKAIGDHFTMIRKDLSTRRPVLEIDSHQHISTSDQLLRRYEIMRTRRSRTVWVATPVLGAALVGFGIHAWRQPYVIPISPQDTRATLLSSLFTWSIGLWRSVSLLAIYALIRQANSDVSPSGTCILNLRLITFVLQEWSRLIETRHQFGISRKLRVILNDVSANNLSFLSSFRAAWMTRTSSTFKVCYIAGLLAPLCAVVAQGALTLLALPVLTDTELDIPLLKRDSPIEVPWSADATLAPSNIGSIGLGQLGTSWTYLEQVIGATISDTMPQGYLVPLRTPTNNTFGSQYPTDVIHIQCECSWVAPTLPVAITNANVSYIPISLESFDITAIQTVPHGAACKFLCKFTPLPTLIFIVLAFAPLSNMTYSSNSTAVTSGIFAWTLWCVN